MQKWEYLFVEALWENDAWRPWRINGREDKDWKKGPSIYDHANQLGQEGWELVTAPFTAHGDVARIKHDDARLFFKRPIPQGGQ